MNSRYRTNMFALIIVAVIIIVGALWAHSHHRKQTQSKTATSHQAQTANVNDPQHYISWQVPDGLAQARCPGTNQGVTFVLRAGHDTSCTAAGPAPILIHMDLEDTTDCNQIEPGDGVVKHTCLSQFIDGHKTLRSATSYNSSSTYGADVTEESYYFNTGQKNEVVLLRYTYSGANSYQNQFNSIINSLKAKT